MFRLIKFVLKTIVMLKLMAIAFAAGMGVAYAIQLRAQYQSWGLVEGGDAASIVGDELVPEADFIETRALDIDVSPAEVWPWLMKLGYGRGGWYSFPALDRAWGPGTGASDASADASASEFDDLAEGDVVPIRDGGGFAVRHVEPAQSLVLYLDDSMAREQIAEMVADASDEAVEAVAEMDMPPYAVSWAFVLEDAPGGRTRLVERVRAHFEVPSEAPRRAMPMVGIGVFAMMRSQMLGIKQRVETVAAGE